MMDIFDMIAETKVPQGLNWSGYQIGVFDWVREGNGGARINAVAGSGKTSTIVAASSMTNGTSLFCAFNKHIEEELSDRVGSLVACKTIHSVGYDALRTTCGRIKLENKKYYELCSKAASSAYPKILAVNPDRKKANVVKLLRKAVDMVRYTLCSPTDLLAFESMCRTYAISMGAEERKIIFEYIEPILKEGNKLAAEGMIDFTDMIYYPVIRNMKMRQYAWVMVDEAQDLSAAQLAIVTGSLKKSGRLVAVGDPYQSIYGFTGADPWSFRNIGKHASMELPLSICYRCPENVLDLARKIVPQIEPRPGAPKGVVREVGDISPIVEPGDMVVCRRNAPLVSHCLKTIAAGKKAYIKGVELKEALTEILDAIKEMTTYDFSKIETNIHLAQAIALNKLLAEGDDESAQRIGDYYDALLGILESRRPRSMTEFVQLVNSIFEESADSVIFSSIHRAKGLEADRVFLVDAGSVRLKWQNQQPWQEFQEQCCEYVALTRAKSELYISVEGGGRYNVGKRISV